MTQRPWHLRVAHPEQYCLEAADAIDAIALPPDKLEEYVRALVAWAGLVVQYMEKGEPYWYGDNLKEQGRAALAPFAHLGGEP